KMAKQASGTEDRALFYSALSMAANPVLAGKTLALSLTNEVPPQMAPRLIAWASSGGQHPELAWEFATQHLTEITSKLGSLGENDYIANLAREFSDNERADELQRFAKEHLSADAAPSVRRAAEEIRIKAKVRERLLEQL